MIIDNFFPTLFFKKTFNGFFWEFHIRNPNPIHLLIPLYMSSALATSLPKEQIFRCVEQLLHALQQFTDGVDVGRPSQSLGQDLGRS